MTWSSRASASHGRSRQAPAARRRRAREALTEAERVQGPRLLGERARDAGRHLRAAGKLPGARRVRRLIATVEALAGRPRQRHGTAALLRAAAPRTARGCALLIGRARSMGWRTWSGPGRVLVDMLPRGRPALPVGSARGARRVAQARGRDRRRGRAAPRRQGDAALAAADAALRRTARGHGPLAAEILARCRGPRRRDRRAGRKSRRRSPARHGSRDPRSRLGRDRRAGPPNVDRPRTDQSGAEDGDAAHGRDALAARVQTFRWHVAARDLGVAADALRCSI